MWDVALGALGLFLRCLETQWLPPWSFFGCAALSLLLGFLNPEILIKFNASLR